MDDIIKEVTENEYQHGFVTEVEQELIPKGLSEDVIRLISRKKNEPQWLLDFRLDAYRKWCKMELPTWAHLRIPPIDFQDIIYYAAPKAKGTGEIDPELGKSARKRVRSRLEMPGSRRGSRRAWPSMRCLTPFQ